MVICSELADNAGIPVTGATENIAAEVIAAHRLLDPVWIEYHPEETTVAGVESFELVVFSDYKVMETLRQPDLSWRLASRSGSPWTEAAWRFLFSARRWASLTHTPLFVVGSTLNLGSTHLVRI